MRSSAPERSIDGLARVTLLLRMFAVLLSVISLADATHRVPGVAWGLILGAGLSFVPLRWWEQVVPRVRAHPAIFAVDVVLSCTLLLLAGPVSPFFVYTLATAMLAGTFYGHFGSAFFAVMLVAGYGFAIDIWAPDWSFMTLVGLPSLYPVVGAGGAHIAATYRRQARDAARLAQAASAEAASRERARLARELHDSVTKTVTGVALQAAALSARLADVGSPLAPVADRLRESAEQAARESRDALVTLRAGAVSRPFPDELGEVVTEIENATGTVIEAGNLDAADIDAPAVRFEVVRILTEAVRNATTHAGATVVRVDARSTADGIDIVVRDDGCGFDPEQRLGQAATDGHFGVVGMVERAQQFGGTVTITSRPGHGTEVTIHVTRPRPAAEPGGAGAPAVAPGRARQVVSA